MATEVLAQAEHDPDAACVVVVTADRPEDGDRLADAVRSAVAQQLAGAPRREVAAAALAYAGAILVADSLAQAEAFTEAYAPEHLSIMTADAAGIAGRSRVEK